MTCNAHGLWLGGLIAVCLSGCGKSHPAAKTYVHQAAVEQTAVPSAAATVPVDPPVATPVDAQPAATEPGIPFAEWIKSIALRTRTAAPIAPLVVPAPRSSMMVELWRQALADVAASRAAAAPGAPLKAFEAAPMPATTIVPLSEPAALAPQATAAPATSYEPPAAQVEKAPSAANDTVARRASDDAARKRYQQSASLYGGGPGYTGEGAGPGFTGVGAGSGYTGAGAGDGYTGFGAGEGYTGAGAGDGYTGGTAGGYGATFVEPPVGMVWTFVAPAVPAGPVVVPPVQSMY